MACVGEARVRQGIDLKRKRGIPQYLELELCRCERCCWVEGDAVQLPPAGILQVTMANNKDR